MAVFNLSNMDFLKKYRIEIFIFLLALVARLVFFFICLHANGGNIEMTVHGQDGYFEISKNLLLGHGFSINPNPPYYPYSYGVPLYSYFLFLLLSLTGSYFVVGMVQLVLGAIIPILGVYVTRLVLSSHDRTPSIVGILLALSPYQILFSFIFYTETVFSILFGMFLILFLKFLKNPLTHYAILSGIFLGLATLTKATVQYVFLVAIVFSFWHFRKELTKDILLKLGYFLVIFALVLSPWFYRNYTILNTFSLSTQMPFNLYGGLLPSVMAIENGTSFASEQKKILDVHPLNLGDPNSTELSKAYAGDAIREIIAHPVALVKLSLVSAITFFTHDGMLTFLQAAQIKPEIYLQRPALVLLVSSPIEFIKTMLPYLHTSMVLVFMARIFWILLTTFFFFGLYRLWRLKSYSIEILFSVAMVLYFMLTTMVNGLSVNARFRMPVEMIIFAVASIAFIELSRYLKNKFPS